MKRSAIHTTAAFVWPEPRALENMCTYEYQPPFGELAFSSHSSSDRIATILCWPAARASRPLSVMRTKRCQSGWRRSTPDSSVSPELDGKRQDILIETVTGARRIGAHSIARPAPLARARWPASTFSGSRRRSSPSSSRRSKLHMKTARRFCTACAAFK
jgi:hypothetical protein